MEPLTTEQRDVLYDDILFLLGPNTWEWVKEKIYKALTANTEEEMQYGTCVSNCPNCGWQGKENTPCPECGEEMKLPDKPIGTVFRYKCPSCGKGGE